MATQDQVKHWLGVWLLISVVCPVGGGILSAELGKEPMFLLQLASIPLTLWVFWLRRLFKTYAEGAMRRRLVGALLISVLPLPVFALHTTMGAGPWLSWLMWGWFGLWAASLTFLGGVFRLVAEWIEERAAFAEDAAAGRAWSPPQRAVGGERAGAAARWAQWAMLLASLGLLLAASLTQQSGLQLKGLTRGTFNTLINVTAAMVCGLTTLGVWLIQRKWVRREAQQGVVFHPGWATIDVMLPWIVGVLSGCVAVFILVTAQVAVGVAVGASVLCLLLLLQLPSLLLRNDKDRWQAAWDAALGEAVFAPANRALQASPLEGSERASISSQNKRLRLRHPSAHLKGLTVRAASSPQALRLRTGDPAFDARFDVLDLDRPALAMLNARARAAMCALHPLGLTVDGEAARCEQPYPWRVAWSVQALSTIAAAWAPPDDEPFHRFAAAHARRGRAPISAAEVEWRLLALCACDPCDTTRALCAEALIACWLEADTSTLWAQLRVHLAVDPPSLALIDALSSGHRLTAAAWASLLNVAAPWPAQATTVAQYVRSAATRRAPPTSARWRAAPPTPSPAASTPTTPLARSPSPRTPPAASPSPHSALSRSSSRCRRAGTSCRRSWRGRRAARGARGASARQRCSL
jgi:hypothetical protein